MLYSSMNVSYLYRLHSTRVGLRKVNGQWKFSDGSPYDYDPPSRNFIGSGNCAVFYADDDSNVDDDVYDGYDREFGDYSCDVLLSVLCRRFPIRGE